MSSLLKNPFSSEPAWTTPITRSAATRGAATSDLIPRAFSIGLTRSISSRSSTSHGSLFCRHVSGEPFAERNRNRPVQLFVLEADRDAQHEVLSCFVDQQDRGSVGGEHQADLVEERGDEIAKREVREGGLGHLLELAQHRGGLLVCDRAEEADDVAQAALRVADADRARERHLFLAAADRTEANEELRFILTQPHALAGQIGRVERAPFDVEELEPPAMRAHRGTEQLIGRRRAEHVRRGLVGVDDLPVRRADGHAFADPVEERVEVLARERRLAPRALGDGLCCEFAQCSPLRLAALAQGSDETHILSIGRCKSTSRAGQTAGRRRLQPALD